MFLCSVLLVGSSIKCVLAVFSAVLLVLLYKGQFLIVFCVLLALI